MKKLHITVAIMLITKYSLIVSFCFATCVVNASAGANESLLTDFNRSKNDPVSQYAVPGGSLKALMAANTSGSTVIIPPGTYTLEAGSGSDGNGSALLVFDVVYNDKTIVADGVLFIVNDPCKTAVLIENASNLTIRGFFAIEYESHAGAGNALEVAGNCDGVYIFKTAFISAAGSGVDIAAGAKNTLVAECVFTGIALSVNIDASFNTVIQSNVFDGYGDKAIHDDGTKTVSIIDNAFLKTEKFPIHKKHLR